LQARASEGPNSGPAANQKGLDMTTTTAPTAQAPTHQVPTHRVSRIAAIVTIVAGIVLAVGGATTWFTVQSNLADERITVSEDSPRFANDAVDGPFTAFQEAQMIEKHYLEATQGKTYAELEREDPTRETAMTASFLRASLFTSVVSFGVAAMAFGLGLVLTFLGYGLLMMTREAPVRS
jgi:hypothetical protein